MRPSADFLLPIASTDEQQLLAGVVAQLNGATPLDAGAGPRAVWERLVELGIHGILLEAGAEQDLGQAEILTIASALGAGLNAETFIWGAVAVPKLIGALQPGGDADDVLSRIESGALATLAMHDSRGDIDTVGSALSLSSTSRATVVSGEVQLVPYPLDADIVVVLATGPEGLVLAEVLDASKVPWKPLEPFDLQTPLANAVFDSVPVRVLGRLEQSAASALALALFCQAAAIAGSAERALVDAVEYSRIREQFGVPISSFQAVRHRLAEALLEVELMHTVLAKAAKTGTEWSMLLASYHCMAAAAAVVRANIQVHGGLGYTWEHSAHRHYRYAFSASQAICSLESLERHLMTRLMSDDLGGAPDD